MEIENINDLKLKKELDKTYTELRIEKLKEERDKALSHVVGTSYYNELAHEKNNEIKRLLRKE